MKLKIFNESDVSSSGGASMSYDGFSGVNTSAGSNVVNYGPNNPYLSNLAEYERRKKSNKDNVYETDYSSRKMKKNNKNAGHKAPKRHHKENYHEPDNWF